MQSDSLRVYSVQREDGRGERKEGVGGWGGSHSPTEAFSLFLVVQMSTLDLTETNCS